MTDLPAGWEWSTLGELGTEAREPVTPEHGVLYELWSVPSFNTGHPEQCDGEEIGSAKLVVQPSDVLVCKINPRINRVWLVQQNRDCIPQIASPEWLVLRVPRDFQPTLAPYLQWYLSSPDFRSWISSAVSGVTGSHTRAKAGTILSQPVPVPPLAEQRRIVTALEDHLSHLKLGNKLRAVERRVDELRRAHLLQLRSTAIERGAVMKPLGSVASTSLGKMIDAKRNTGQPTPYLRNINVRWRKFDLSEVLTAPMGDAERERLILRRGDLLVCEGGEPGRCAIWQDDRYMTYQKALHRVRVGPTVSTEWLAIMIEEAVRNGRVNSLLTGTTIKHLPQEKLRSLTLPIPSLDSQARLVDHFSSAVKVEDRLFDSLKAIRARSENLRQSLLTEAFAGRLVRQDPGDEPAAELLGRIRAERAVAGPKRRGRRTAGPVQKETLL